MTKDISPNNKNSMWRARIEKDEKLLYCIAYIIELRAIYHHHRRSQIMMSLFMK